MMLRLPFAFGVSSIIHVFLTAWLSAPLAGYKGSAPALAGASLAALQVRMATTLSPSAAPPPSSSSLVMQPGPSRPLPPGGTIYWPTSLLDRQPEIIDDIPIDPPELRPHAEGGSLILEVRISIDGDVEDITVAHTDLPEVFVDSLTRHFRAARFHPGMRDGYPVRTRMRVLLEVQGLKQEGGSIVQVVR